MYSRTVNYIISCKFGKFQYVIDQLRILFQHIDKFLMCTPDMILQYVGKLNIATTF